MTAGADVYVMVIETVPPVSAESSALLVNAFRDSKVLPMGNETSVILVENNELQMEEWPGGAPQEGSVFTALVQPPSACDVCEIFYSNIMTQLDTYRVVQNLQEEGMAIEDVRVVYGDHYGWKGLGAGADAVADPDKLHDVVYVVNDYYHDDGHMHSYGGGVAFGLFLLVISVIGGICCIYAVWDTVTPERWYGRNSAKRTEGQH